MERFTDEQGVWERELDEEGRVVFAALIEPSQEYEDNRAAVNAAIAAEPRVKTLDERLEAVEAELATVKQELTAANQEEVIR